MNPPADLPTPAPRTVKKAIRLTAYFEALKGAFVLLAAAGLLSLPTADLYTFALKLVEHAHLNPAAKYPDIFLTAARNLQNSKFVLIALGAAAYSTIRFVEAYGLFRERTWAEVLAAVSAAIYLPFELVEARSSSDNHACAPCSSPMRRSSTSWSSRSRANGRVARRR